MALDDNGLHMSAGSSKPSQLGSSLITGIGIDETYTARRAGLCV